jgi:uncharacterized protein (TIGR03435 family)
MRELAQVLSALVPRVVVDRTGLVGNFEFELMYAPDPFPQGAVTLDAPPPPTNGGPSLVTALQEQLGLRLEAQRGPVVVVVVESIERATAD